MKDDHYHLNESVAEVHPHVLNYLDFYRIDVLTGKPQLRCVRCESVLIDDRKLLEEWMANKGPIACKTCERGLELRTTARERLNTLSRGVTGQLDGSIHTEIMLGGLVPYVNIVAADWNLFESLVQKIISWHALEASNRTDVLKDAIRSNRAELQKRISSMTQWIWVDVRVGFTHGLQRLWKELRHEPLPETCPYTLGDILSDNFFPGTLP